MVIVGLVCGMWGTGIEEVGKDEEIHQRLLRDGELSFGVWRKGMEKEVYTLCVILMEDG